MLKCRKQNAALIRPKRSNRMAIQNVVNDTGQNDYCQLRGDGAGGGYLFYDESDYIYFLSIIEQNLLVNDSVKVLAYCLAPDHFYLLLNRTGEGGVEHLMYDIVADYNKYFDQRYGVEDLLLRDYAMSDVSGDDLLAVSRDIHIEVADWINCEYSSIRSYLYDDTPKWLDKTDIKKRYGSAMRYLSFLTAT